MGGQCLKLRVHPAPVVHISTTRCTILGVHLVCACFLSHLLLLYIGRVHGAISGRTVLWEVHAASAQSKSLISDTGGTLGSLQCPKLGVDPVPGTHISASECARFLSYLSLLRMGIVYGGIPGIQF